MSMITPRYIMIGGFLGAGKTTAIVECARHLAAKNLSSGIITNDQSVNLVDTARVSAAGFPVQEITGGCFCCRFDSLIAASNSLCESSRPDLLIAEPVGSCTDLQATVGIPLRRLHGDSYHLAPFSVLIDPSRFADIALRGGKEFDPKVNYIYRKQLEEADFLVLNKIDLLNASQRSQLVSLLKSDYPRARIFEVSCQTGEGLGSWFDAVLSTEGQHRATMQIDYDTYADGEALLGWLNATAPVQASAEFDGNEFLMTLSERLRGGLQASGSPVAHVKMTLASDAHFNLAAVSATHTKIPTQVTSLLASRIRAGTLTINLRAQCEPELLRKAVETQVKSMPNVSAALRDISAFRPGRPTPTHRMVVAADS